MMGPLGGANCFGKQEQACERSSKLSDKGDGAAAWRDNA